MTWAEFVQTTTCHPDPDGRDVDLVRFSYLVRDHNGDVVYRGTNRRDAEAIWEGKRRKAQR